MLTVGKMSDFPLLAGLEPSFLEQLALIAQEMTIASGEWLFHEGENADALYLISQGKIELRFRLDRNRSIYVDLKTLGAGDALGWSALVPPYTYSMGATAAEDVELFRIDSESLRVLVEDHPEQGYALMQGIAQTMATRLTTLSEQAPRLSLRLVTSLALFGLGAVVLLIFLVLGILAVGSAIGGRPQALSILPQALLCVIVPVLLLLLLARSIYPGESRTQPRPNDN